MINLEAEIKKLEKARNELKTCKSHYRRKDLNRFIFRKRNEIAEAKARMKQTEKGAVA